MCSSCAWDWLIWFGFGFLLGIWCSVCCVLYGRVVLRKCLRTAQMRNWHALCYRCSPTASGEDVLGSLRLRLWWRSKSDLMYCSYCSLMLTSDFAGSTHLITCRTGRRRCWSYTAAKTSDYLRLRVFLRSTLCNSECRVSPLQPDCKSMLNESVIVDLVYHLD